MNKKLVSLITGIIITILGIYFYVFSGLNWILAWAILMAGIILIAYGEYLHNKTKTNSRTTKQPVKTDFSESVN